MSNFFYHILRLLGILFRYRGVGLEGLPPRGAALYVANHVGHIGPIQCILSLPVRFHPWVVAEMCDYRLAPAYLFADFVEPVLGLRGRFGQAISAALSVVAVSLIRALQPIPVHKENGLFDRSIPHSIEFLRRGRSLLIFPEDPEQEGDPDTGIRPFGLGYCWVSYRYQELGRTPLPVYPLTVVPSKRRVLVGEPLYLPLDMDPRQGLRPFCARVRQAILDTYRQTIAMP
ncbi:MAG: hypothetical protein H5T69_08375 [Chloroflexi bacterium]|nr:hypothetical protein [Chloroflexota bacterium]